MTLQELAALPVGTRIRLPLRHSGAIMDYATVAQTGNEVRLDWDGGVTNLINTKSSAWESFVFYMEVA